MKIILFTHWLNSLMANHAEQNKSTDKQKSVNCCCCCWSCSSFS